MTSARRTPLRREDLLLVTPLAFAALFGALGRGHAALRLALLGMVLVVLRLLLGDLVPTWIARLVSAISRLIRAVVMGLAWATVILPAWAFDRLTAVARRQRPSDRVRGCPSGPGWSTSSAPTGSSNQTFAGETGGGRAGPGVRLIRLVGVIVVLMVVDAGSGVAWQAVTRSTSIEAITTPLGLHRDGTFHDVRADSPALGGAPWAVGHYRDLQHLPQSYWPQVLTRPRPFASETIHIDGWHRRSYEPGPRSEATDLPVIWFFGGSTAFGEGQRDEHTIASYIARLAEEAGTPVRVVNFGQRSWTAWQEALLFEQLSSHDRPDLVVFYDGANEVLQQTQDSTAGWPTHFNVDGVARQLTGARAGAGTRTSHFSPPSPAAEMVDWYRGHSMIFRSARWISHRIDPDSSEANSNFDSNDPPEVVGHRAATVYRRARTFAHDTASNRGIPSLFFWQPVPHWRTDQTFRTATRHLGTGSIVISDALDHDQDVFIDNVHTNERGADLVAGRMWVTLRARLGHR